MSVNAHEVSCSDIDFLVSVDLVDGDDEATVLDDSAASALGVIVSGGNGKMN